MIREFDLIIKGKANIKNVKEFHKIIDNILLDWEKSDDCIITSTKEELMKNAIINVRYDK